MKFCQLCRVALDEAGNHPPSDCPVYAQESVMGAVSNQAREQALLEYIAQLEELLRSRPFTATELSDWQRKRDALLARETLSSVPQRKRGTAGL